MRIERHIFGSFSGYTTLAKSAGLGAEDCRALESGAYGFGQVHDRQFTRTLGKNPAWFTRLLSGGRRGLTRVMEGTADDNQRPTMRLVTVVLTQRDWDNQLCGDVSALLDCAGLWEWDGQAAISPSDLDTLTASSAVPRKSVEKILGLVSELERHAGRRMVVVSSDEYGLAEMRAIEMLVPPAARRHFTSSSRSLSAQLAVSVNAVAPEAGAAGRITFRYRADAEHLSPYAQYLRQTELMEGTVPVERVAAYRQFGVSEGRVAAGTSVTSAPAAAVLPLAAAPTKAKVWPVALAAVLGLSATVGGVCVGFHMGAGAAATAERTEREVQINRALSDQANSYEDKLHQTLEVPRGAYDDMLLAARHKAMAAATAPAPATVASASGAGSADDGARGEHSVLRSFYDAQAQKQRARYIQLQEEIDQIFVRLNARKLAEEQGHIARIDSELAGLQDEWPLLPEDHRKWLVGLREAKATMEDLNTLAPKVGRIMALLEGCRDAKEHFDQQPSVALMSELRTNLADLHEQVRALPDKYEHLRPALLGDLRHYLFDAAGEMDKWLKDHEKPPEPGPKPEGGGLQPPNPGPHKGGSK